MKRVTLIFNSIESLRKFEKIIKAGFLVINLKRKTIICECTEAEIDLAVKDLEARIAEQGNVFRA